MADIKLKHLEHLEDMMLDDGTAGCKEAVKFMEELLRMLGKKPAGGYVQTKWDGAPSVVCGTDPATGSFFVGNKSVFNKVSPKLCFTPEDIDVYYGKQPGLATKLYAALKYFKPLGIKGVIQGDLMYTQGDKKREVINGEELVTFRANTITYGVPIDQPLGHKIDNSKIGVVFHTHYQGSDIETMSAQPGAPIKTFANTQDCAVIANDTPMDEIEVDKTTLTQFATDVRTIEMKCIKAGDFLDHLVSNMGTTGEKKFHIASYLKMFFNSEIKNQRMINAESTLKELGKFYHTKMMKEISKVKNQAPKRELMYKGLQYMEDNYAQFKAMLELYKKIQEAKQHVLEALDKLESFRTYVESPTGYRLTNPEGYVLHMDGKMIKIVNRLEFSYINFTLPKDGWK